MTFGFNKKAKKRLPAQGSEQQARDIGRATPKIDALEGPDTPFISDRLYKQALAAFDNKDTLPLQALFKTVADHYGGKTTVRLFNEPYKKNIVETLTAFIVDGRIQNSTDLLALLNQMTPLQRQEALDLTLRDICASNKTVLQHVDLLIKAGADVHSFDERPLMNALGFNSRPVARHLIINHAASIERAYETGVRIFSQAEERYAQKCIDMKLSFSLEKGDVAECFEIAREWASKKSVLHMALQRFADGNPEQLQDFMRLYMELKRGHETSRTPDEGLRNLVMIPVFDLLVKAERPDHLLDLVTQKMVDRDRQAFLDLLLLQACEKTSSISLVKTLVGKGADPHAQAERALRAAVQAGHTDIALFLFNDKGADPQVALLDLQMNEAANTEKIMKMQNFIISALQLAQRERMPMRTLKKPPL